MIASLLLLLLLYLQLGRIQLFVANQIFSSLEDKLDVSFHIAEIKIDPLLNFHFNQFLIRDHHLDTLIYVESGKGELTDLYRLRNRILPFENVKITNGWVNDFIYPGESKSSLTVFSQKFNKKKQTKKTLALSFHEVVINHIRYVRGNRLKTIVDFHHISGHVQDLEISGPNVTVHTDSLSLKDIYGIEYKKLATDFTYTRSQMSFKNTHIVSNYSDLHLDVDFSNTASSYSDFVEKVKLDGAIYRSKIAIKDINKIYPHFKGKQLISLDSKVKGTLNDLRLNKAKMTSNDGALMLKGKLRLKNSINHRENLRFHITKGLLKADLKRVKGLIPDQYHKNIRERYQGLSVFEYSGDLDVTRKELDLEGSIKTKVGYLKLKGGITNLDTPNRSLDIKVDDGFVSEIPQVKDLKNVKFRGDVKGLLNSKSPSIAVNLTLKNLHYKKINLLKSKLKFNLNKKLLSVDFESKDPLLMFDAHVKQRKSGSVNEYDIDFKVDKLYLYRLFPKHMFYQKNIKTTGCFNIVNKENEFSLQGDLRDINIVTQKDSISLNGVDVLLSSKGKENSIALNSEEFLKLDLHGAFNYSDLKGLVKNALFKLIPGEQERVKLSDQTLVFKLEAHPNLGKFLTDKVWIDDDLGISGMFDANGDKGIVQLKIPSISSKEFKIDSLEFVFDNQNKWLNSNISIKKVKLRKQLYEGFSLLGKKVNDTLFVRSNFQSDKIKNSAIFNLTTKDDVVSLGIENIDFKYLNLIWINKPDKENKIHYNYKSKDWFFHELSFANGNQQFDFGGTVKKDLSKNLKLSLKNVDLTEVLPGIERLSVGGIASGEMYFKEKNTLLEPEGSLKIEKFKVNGVYYGDLLTSIKPNNKRLGYDLIFNITNQEIQNIDAVGEILVNENNFLASKIDLKVLLNNLKLSSLSPLGKNVLSAIRGKAQGAFSVTGSLGDFDTNGYINLKETGLKFPYLNTDYNFLGDARVDINGKTFVFNKIAIKDALYNTDGVLSGEIDFDKYNNWNLNLRISTDNLLVLNTTQQEGSKYFGTAFMRGFATIKGVTSDLSINVTGTTLPNTKFVLPINDVKQVEYNKFVYFKESQKVDDSIVEERSTNTGGVSVVLNIDVTKDALGEVVIDQVSGSSLQGRANGRLLIDFDKLFNVKMYGDLVVDEGLYNFKYGGFVNKPFTVKKGGTVSWNGDPFKAELNIEALHQVKANPKVLLESLSVNRKMDVDLITKVTGELFNSKQEFVIEIPNASSTVASELDFKLNIDQNSKMRQFFSLLVTKNFYDENNVNSTSTALSSTTSEIISNVVTEIFNKEEDKFHINFGYTSGENSEIEDLVIDNQIDIGLATEINDRVLINGKLGVPVGAKTQSTVVGEVKVEFLLNRDGSLRSSVFNRQNEIQYSEEEQGYTQGVGLSYQIDFNKLTEMLEKIGLKKRKKQKKNKTETFEITDDELFYVLPDLF